MKFSELDRQMRIYETARDYCVPSGFYIVARLDGRSFSRLTEKAFSKPFDDAFNAIMVETTEGLMADTGVECVYGYTQSDEISLLMSPRSEAFGRKERKLVSILAGFASAFMTAATSHLALPADARLSVFDCRLSILPSYQRVIDYFRWRAEDAFRNALHGYCYWQQRHCGVSAGVATSTLDGMNNAAKHEFLFLNGFNFNDAPNWQKRGVGVVWKTITKPVLEPQRHSDQVATAVTRRELAIDRDLPVGDAYSTYIKTILEEGEKDAVSADANRSASET